LLQDGPQLPDVFSVNPLPNNKQSFLFEQAQDTAKEWKENTPGQKIELLSTALTIVTIGREKVVFICTRKWLFSILGADDVLLTS